MDDVKGMDERNVYFKRYFRKHKSGLRNKYPHWINLDEYRLLAKTLLKDNRQRAIQRALQLQKNLIQLFEDTDNASSDLDAYIEILNDLHREG